MQSRLGRFLIQWRKLLGRRSILDLALFHDEHNDPTTWLPEKKTTRDGEKKETEMTKPSKERYQEKYQEKYLMMLPFGCHSVVSDFWISKRTREKKRGSQLSSFSCITFSNRRSSFFFINFTFTTKFLCSKKRKREKNKKEKEAQTIFQKRTWWSFFFFSSNPQLSHTIKITRCKTPTQKT